MIATVLTIAVIANIAFLIYATWRIEKSERELQPGIITSEEYIKNLHFVKTNYEKLYKKYILLTERNEKANELIAELKKENNKLKQSMTTAYNHVKREI